MENYFYKKLNYEQKIGPIGQKNGRKWLSKSGILSKDTFQSQKVINLTNHMIKT